MDRQTAGLSSYSNQERSRGPSRFYHLSSGHAVTGQNNGYGLTRANTSVPSRGHLGEISRRRRKTSEVQTEQRVSRIRWPVCISQGKQKLGDPQASSVRALFLVSCFLFLSFSRSSPLLQSLGFCLYGREVCNQLYLCSCAWTMAAAGPLYI